MSTKKIKVKVKKKKIKTKKVIIVLILFASIISVSIFGIKLPIKNIYVKGNKLVNDKTIIELADISNYPSFISTYFSNLKKNILKNEYISNVQIKRDLQRKVYIEVEEYKPICIYKEKLVLSSTKIVDNIYNINYVPYVINDIDEIYEEFVKKFSIVNEDVLLKISQIEYTPNELDKERFLLYMTDANYVYITLSKIEKINKYNSILQKLENKKGIIHLDSGDYIEIKD